MIKLTFKDSISTCHKIVTDSNGKRYIMDTSTLTPNVYGFGFLPKQITIDMFELSRDNQSFEQRQKASSKYIGLAAATQPLTTLLYRMFKQLFLTYNIHEQALLKGILVLLSIVVGLILAKIYIALARKKAAERLSSSAKKYRITFTFTGKRHYAYWFMIAFIFIFVWLFLSVNNGTEGLTLLPITFLSFLFFVIWLGMVPIDYHYNHNIIKLVSLIEEVK